MRVDLVVVLKSSGQLGEHGPSGRAIMNVDVVAFESLHEGLSHSAGLRTAYRDKAGNQPQTECEIDRVVGSRRCRCRRAIGADGGV